MTIKVVPAAPPNTDELLQTAVENLAALAPTAKTLGGATAEYGKIGLVEAIPIYSVEAETFLRKKSLDGLHPVGWRSLVLSEGGPPAFADVSVATSEKPEFSQLTRGTIVDNLYAAIIFIEDKFGAEGTDVELSILEIPAANRGALWLRNASRSEFVPYVNVGHSGSYMPKIDPNFLETALEELRLIMGDGTDDLKLR